MNQSRLESLAEASINTAIGFGVALASQLVVFPLVGVEVPLQTNLHIGAWFTLISIVRGYVIRRWFNARIHKLAQRLTQGEKV